MLAGEFLETVEYLCAQTWPLYVARALGISKRWLQYLRNLEWEVTPKVLKKAEEVFPALIANPPKKYVNNWGRGLLETRKVYYVERHKQDFAKEAREQNRIRKENLLRGFQGKASHGV